ncbi:hypothetical protein TWF696_003094 [Orbilia brochopaga]|uniref:PNPLA domain-containing protein n=1 Tax=Orbilia brochopaga TaxID=3140254 RepID=A0AAV9U1W7_9PEZI
MDLKKELEALAYTDPPHYLTPPHELEILNQPNSRRLSYIHASAPPLRLLSLDGGGVKGYSSLLLLQELMYRVFIEINGRPPQMHEIPLPCDHFDLIGGVGTGGLIALMLGRLRMDVESCKHHWVKMTKRVFETDKRIAGIPYKTTFYKASRLETVIREIVKEYTVDEVEMPAKTHSRNERSSSRARGESRRSREHSRSRQVNIQTEDERQQRERETKVISSRRSGNSEALLYDPRESRCKTFVAATYQNSPEGAPPCLLRNYLSLTTLNPEPNVKIWEAGRATAATMAAFKPIQIGQTIFQDEGAGRYNICPTVIEEAMCNEWPGRTVGCVLSIGTGKPTSVKQSAHQWWESKLHKPFDTFTEAKRRLMYKTHLSDVTHQMLIGQGPDSLDKWGIHRDDYFRLNVDMGESDFAMNEWQKLSDISTITRRWLSSPEGKQMIGNCALKLATIWRAKNIPPPKSPLRQLPIMAELPVEPITPLITRPASAAAQATGMEPPPRPSSRMRALSQIPDRQYSSTPTSFSYKPISRSRTIQTPPRHHEVHKHMHTQSLPRVSRKDTYYTPEEEHDDAVKPRPLIVRQRVSTATNSTSNSSSNSSIMIDGGVVEITTETVQEKGHSNSGYSPTSCAAPDRPPVPIKRAMTVVERGVNTPYPDE